MSIPLTKLRKIQKQIGIIINKIEKEAVDNGEDISTEEFREGIKLLTDKLLTQYGTTPEEYKSTLEEISIKKKETVEKEKAEMKEDRNQTKEIFEKITQIKGDKGDKGDVGPQGKTGPQGPQGERGPKGEKGDKGDRGPEGKRGKDGKNGKNGRDGKTYLLPNIKKTVRKEIDSFRKEVDTMIKAAIKDSADLIMQNPELIKMPAFRALGMGLQAQIDDSILSVATIDLDSQCDGSNQTFSLGRKVKGVILVNNNGGLVSDAGWTLNDNKNQITLNDYAPENGEELEVVALV